MLAAANPAGRKAAAVRRIGGEAEVKPLELLQGNPLPPILVQIGDEHREARHRHVNVAIDGAREGNPQAGPPLSQVGIHKAP